MKIQTMPGITAFEAIRNAVVAHIDEARELLSIYAKTTDRPEHGAVECADLLDLACDALERVL